MNVLTVRDAASRLKVSRATVFAWIRQGELRSMKLGRCRRIREEDLTDMLHRHLSGREAVA